MNHGSLCLMLLQYCSYAKHKLLHTAVDTRLCMRTIMPPIENWIILAYYSISSINTPLVGQVICYRIGKSRLVKLNAHCTLCIPCLAVPAFILQEQIRNSPQFELNLGLLFTPELEHQRYSLPGNIIPILMAFAIQINDISTLKLNLHTLLQAKFDIIQWYSTLVLT